MRIRLLKALKDAASFLKGIDFLDSILFLVAETGS
jgi:hypothetical protein